MALRIGIIGAGTIGRTHVNAAKAVGVEVTAISDVNEDAASKMAHDAGATIATSDPHKVFTSPDVDAVIVGVPNKFHHPLALAALEAGKDVFLEKPMAMNVEQCREINQVAARTGRLVQIGFVHRFSPVGLTARAMVDAGRVGKVYHAKASIYRRRGIPGLGGWFTTKAVSGGGPLIDIGVHVLDLVMHLMSFPNPTRVSGKVYANFGCRLKDYVYEGMWAGPPRYDGTCDVEDAAHAFIRLEGGAALDLNATWAGNFAEEAMPNLIGVFGDKGGVTFQLGGKEVRLATEADGHNVDILPKLHPGNGYESQLAAFAESVKTRQIPFGATGQQGQIVQTIIDAIYRSSEEDREVEVTL